jgi:nucleotidyltransferase substrate binding protein (TIGR01987 family)
MPCYTEFAMQITFQPLDKALSALQTANRVWHRFEAGGDVELTETARSGTIQNFEVAYEQSWKLLKRWMEHYLGVQDGEVTQRRQLFRLAGKHGLIDDVEQWWGFHEARNKTSHVYNEQVARDVALVASSFIAPCEVLIATLKTRTDTSDQVGPEASGG